VPQDLIRFGIRFGMLVIHKIPRRNASIAKRYSFYEAHPGLPRPRFICSSKSACYMCKLFFSLHGGFYLPRTHGRLYDKWTLPDWLDIPAEQHSELSRISTLLKGTIDGKVLRASNRKRKTYHFPNESVLPPPASWSSSGISSNVDRLGSIVR